MLQGLDFAIPGQLASVSPFERTGHQQFTHTLKAFTGSGAHSKQGEKQSDTLTKVSVHEDGIELPDYDGLITTGLCSDCHYINQETET